MERAAVSCRGFPSPPVAHTCGRAAWGGGRFLRVWQHEDAAPSCPAARPPTWRANGQLCHDKEAKPARVRVSTYFPASTFTLPFGASPNISGAYIASTRVGGSENSPTLFRRMVYSIFTMPLGRYS